MRLIWLKHTEDCYNFACLPTSTAAEGNLSLLTALSLSNDDLSSYKQLIKYKLGD